MSDEPTQLERYYALKMRIKEMTAEMGLDLEHCSIVMDEDPKVALVFTVLPEAFTDDTVVDSTDSEFDDIINNMLNSPSPLPEVNPVLKIQKEIEDFLNEN